MSIYGDAEMWFARRTPRRKPHWYDFSVACDLQRRMRLQIIMQRGRGTFGGAEENILRSHAYKLIAVPANVGAAVQELSKEDVRLLRTHRGLHGRDVI